MIKKLKRNAKLIDDFLKSYLKSQKKTELLNPMRYGVLDGGKKIRSSIILSLGKIFDLKIDKLKYLCSAVECIHSYSLIHDDLPCMDNDTLRRGKPTAHIKFGESTALLAGSSLLTLAFEIISDSKFKISKNKKLELIKLLAISSGHTGIAGGQELDLAFEKKEKSFNEIIKMQKMKTGRLFSYSCEATGIIKGLKKNQMKNLNRIGENIGLLFQIKDDILDLTGNKKKMGKPTKRDFKKGKSTTLSLMGFKKTTQFAKKIRNKLLKDIEKYGRKSNDLRLIINYILDRNY